MNCLKCGAKIETGSLFCVHCGAKVEQPKKFCPKCGAGMKEDALFCECCGAKYSDIKKVETLQDIGKAKEKNKNIVLTERKIATEAQKTKQTTPKTVLKLCKQVKNHKFAIFILVIAIFAVQACTKYKSHADWYYKVQRPLTIYFSATVLCDKDAMNQLGVLYSRGEFVGKSEKKAFKWIEKSAEAGNAWGMYNLAQCYKDGEGVKQDTLEAIKWYKKAAACGNTTSMICLGDLYYSGEIVEKNYFAAFDLFANAAKAGDKTGMGRLGWMYANGVGVVKDYSKALYWCKKGARGDHDGIAPLVLGGLFYYGCGVAVDYNEAVKWYKESADWGNNKAMYELGKMYDFGEGVEQNKDEAIRWYKKAAEKGNVEAKARLEDFGIRTR